MAKKDKGAKSEISRSGVLTLDDEQHKAAMERKEYSKRGATEKIPSGTYNAEIEEATLEVQGGTGVTAGSDKIALKLRVTEGEQKGRSVFARAIAHGSTGGTFLNLLEAVGVDLESMGQRIRIPTEKEVAAWVGQPIVAFVSYKKDADWPDVGLGAPEEGSAKKAGGAKKKKSKIAV